MDSDMGAAIATLTETSLADARRAAQLRKPQPQQREVSIGEACARMVKTALPVVVRQAKKLAQQRGEIVKHGGQSLTPSNIANV